MATALVTRLVGEKPLDQLSDDLGRDVKAYLVTQNSAEITDLPPAATPNSPRILSLSPRSNVVSGILIINAVNSPVDPQAPSSNPVALNPRLFVLRSSMYQGTKLGVPLISWLAYVAKKNIYIFIFSLVLSIKI